MDDYTNAMKIQELREQRVDLLWEHITSHIIIGTRSTNEVLSEIMKLDKQIKELQNG